MSGGVLVTNPHYVRPSATDKGQTGDVRTPLSVDLSLEDSQCSVPDDSQSETTNCGQHEEAGKPLFLLPLLAYGFRLSNWQVVRQDKADQSSIINRGDKDRTTTGREAPKEAQGRHDWR